MMSLLETVGRRAMTYWATRMQNPPAMDVEVNEVWGFIGMKEKTRQRWFYSEEYGDCYTFTAIEKTSKLLLAYHVGRRTSIDTAKFAERWHAIDGRCQMSVDGFQPYETVIPAVFGGQVDLAQLVKIFGNPSGTPEDALLARPDNERPPSLCLRIPGPRQGLHFPYRAAQPFDPNGGTSNDAVDERFRQEEGQPRISIGGLLPLLQLLPGPLDHQDDASRRGGAYRQDLVGRKTVGRACYGLATHYGTTTSLWVVS